MIDQSQAIPVELSKSFRSPGRRVERVADRGWFPCASVTYAQNRTRYISERRTTKSEDNRSSNIVHFSLILL